MEGKVTPQRKPWKTPENYRHSSTESSQDQQQKEGERKWKTNKPKTMKTQADSFGLPIGKGKRRQSRKV